MIRIMLVDDHQLFRAGLREMMAQSEGIEIVAEAASGDAALEALKKVSVDVVLLDVLMPGMTAHDILPVLQKNYPNIACIILTSVEDEITGSNLLNSGALSYITKSCNNTVLFETIQKAYRKERFVSPEISQRLAYRLIKQKTQKNTSYPFSKLSFREIECLKLMAKGKHTKEISSALNIHPKTINTYRHRLYQKFEVHNEVDLIRQAIRYELIDPKSLMD